MIAPPAPLTYRVRYGDRPLSGLVVNFDRNPVGTYLDPLVQGAVVFLNKIVRVEAKSGAGGTRDRRVGELFDFDVLFADPAADPSTTRLELLDRFAHVGAFALAEDVTAV